MPPRPSLDEQILTCHEKLNRARELGDEVQENFYVEAIQMLRDKRDRGAALERLASPPPGAGLKDVGRLLGSDRFPLDRLLQAAALDPTMRQRIARRWEKGKATRLAEFHEARALDAADRAGEVG